MFSRLSIGAKIVIPVTILLMGIPIAGTYIYAQIQERAFERDIRVYSDEIIGLLEGQHSESMKHRQDIADEDNAVQAFDMSVAYFNQKSERTKMWIVQGPKVLAFQKDQQAFVEPAKDSIDQAALDSGSPASLMTEQTYRMSRPVIMGQGAAADKACLQCHGELMGIAEGQVLGAYSIAVDLTSDRAAQHITQRLLYTSAVLIGLIIALVTAWFLNRYIASPISSMTGLMNRLAAGDTEFKIPYSQQGKEIGAMAKALTKFKDNTHRRRQAELLLSTAINSLHDGFALFDDEDRLVLCNDKYKEYNKTSADLMIPGSRFEDIIRFGAERGQYPEAIGRIDEWINERLQGHRSDSFIIEQELGDGRWLRAAEFRTSDGGTAGVWIDITELKNKEQELIESETRLRDYAETSADWFWEMDSDLQFSSFSSNSSEYAFDPNGLIGKKRWDYEVGDASDENWKKHNEDLENHRPFRNFEYTRSTPDGTDIHISISGKPVFAPDGAFLGYRGSGSDITDLITLQENLESARQKAEAANQAKSEFLASMSHEIRTPMAGIKGFAELLLEDDLTEESREKVFRLQDSVDILLSLLNEILDLSKLEAGKMELEHVDFQLPSLINEATSLFEHSLGKGKISLEVSLSDDFPETVNSDPTRLRQVLLNLIGNAVKFTEHGEIKVEGSLTPFETGQNGIRFAIHDTGIGIKPETLDNLFEDFTQADASISRRYQGSGLGLSICKRLVELMGGEIGAESEYHKGSTFWFTLPYTAARSQVANKPERTAATQTRYLATRPLHILVVDDNYINLRIVTATVTSFGHTTEIAKDGMMAIETFEAGDFDLVLMDVRMPVLSGPEATKLIRKMGGKKSTVPIIALTADAMEEHKREYLAAGMDAMVGKPLDREDLALTINDVMHEIIHQPVKDDQ